MAGITESKTPSIKGKRRAYFPEAGKYLDTYVYDRSHLIVGENFNGPAIIEEEGSTFIVGPGAFVEVSTTGNLVVTINE